MFLLAKFSNEYCTSLDCFLGFLEQHPKDQYIHNSEFSNFDVNFVVGFFFFSNSKIRNFFQYYSENHHNHHITMLQMNMQYSGISQECTE